MRQILWVEKADLHTLISIFWPLETIKPKTVLPPDTTRLCSDKNSDRFSHPHSKHTKLEVTFRVDQDSKCFGCVSKAYSVDCFWRFYFSYQKQIFSDFSVETKELLRPTQKSAESADCIWKQFQ